MEDKTISDAGICPALEKHGKLCQILLGREDVHLIQTTLEADGMLICARWAIVRTGPLGWQFCHNS